MTSLTDYTVSFNKNLKVSFNGGNLSSDAGLLIPRSFDEALGLSRLIEACFPQATKRCHSTADVIRQLIYTTIAGYHADDASDRLRIDPVFTHILNKKALASQPTISRCLNHFDAKMLKTLDQLLLDFVEKAYAANQPEYVVLDVDSTHIDIHGHQENSAYNYHYGSTGEFLALVKEKVSVML
ncbi:transposase [Eubacteriaceae bacterium ES2]|nr:transposase [Eubacteriaceae bacterium ES2]